MFVGVDIGGTKTAVLVADESGEVLAQLTQPTVVSDLVAQVIGSIEAALDRVRGGHAPLQAIGVGIPGMVDPEKGEVLLAVNLKITEPLPLAQKLREGFGVPVRVENDVRLAALGVYQRLRTPNLVYVGIGTGVSAGVVLNGEVHRGANGVAGEIGYVPLDEHGTILEELIAGPGIVRQAKAAGLDPAHAGDVYAWAAAGNLEATAVITRVSQALTSAIQWLILAYDVDVIAFGGGVTASGEAFLAPLLACLAERRERSQLNQMLLTADKIRLMPSDFNAGLWGGIHVAGLIATGEHQNGQ